MPTLRQAREMLLLAYVDQVIDDHEFVLLFDVNEEKKSGISLLDLHSILLIQTRDDECRAEFRFWKNDIYDLSDVLDLPDEIIIDNRQNVDKIDSLGILLKRFAYPCRYLRRFSSKIWQSSTLSL